MNKKKYEKPAVIYTEYCGAPVSSEKVSADTKPKPIGKKRLLCEGGGT